MRRDVTELFLRYREITRLIWNLGYWPIIELREWDTVECFEKNRSTHPRVIGPSAAGPSS